MGATYPEHASVVELDLPLPSTVDYKRRRATLSLETSIAPSGVLVFTVSFGKAKYSFGVDFWYLLRGRCGLVVYGAQDDPDAHVHIYVTKKGEISVSVDHTVQFEQEG